MKMDFQTRHDRMTKFFIGWFVFVALLSVGMIGLIAYAIIRAIDKFL